ncbi:dihydroorotase [Psychrilyobacter atlanticus]|uniref:dihydroorotase n=1 Tax=Psychrilyobacter atlanticus TaxID=271091 RepID=UPI000429F398|nr:amidohydrolase family protein [Psychrilyobacter atlanticus]
MLIKNARINTIDNEYEIKDIYIKDGKIAEIGSDVNSLNIIRETFLSSDENIKKLEIIDLKGKKYLIPGVIDPHVHMRDPGLTHKEDLYTGSRACAKGGITTFIDMPNTIPTTTNLSALQDKKDLASIKSLVNYGFHFGGTSTDNSDIIPSEGVASTKVFMNISTGKMLVEKDEVLKNIFLKSKMVSVHAEGEMVEKAITYNEKYGKKLYLCHISNEKELDIIRKNREIATKKIYTEVTPHHLFLSENDIKGKNEMLFRMKPELKTNDDIEALWKAINDGTIDTIGTDHAPHLLSEKLEKVTFGIPGVENSLPLMLDAVSKEKITLSKLIELMSKNPSKIFGIKDRGEIKEGYYGDLVVVDLEKKFTLENKTTLSKCGWTPFDGYTGFGKIETTIVNGTIVYNKNQIIENTGSEIEYE